MKSNCLIKGKKGQHLNQREINLINSGAIEGVLRMDVKPKNNSVVLTCITEGLVGLQKFLQMNEMSKRLFVVLLRNIVVALKSVESNKLNCDLIMWELNTSYVDPKNWHVYLTYVPLQPYETIGTFKTFLLDFVSGCNFTSTEGVEYVQQLVEILNLDVAYTVSKLEDYCNVMSAQLVESTTRKVSVPVCPRCLAKLMPQEALCPYCGMKTRNYTNHNSTNNHNEMVRSEKTVDFKQRNVAGSYNINGNFSVNEDEHGVITVFRGTRSAQQIVWLEELERVGKIVVTKFPFRIGKMDGVTDHCIFNNKVSRKHADIIKDQGRYYVIDLGSTNGTYLHGKKIQPGVKEPLNDGSMIKFADTEFKFHID